MQKLYFGGSRKLAQSRLLAQVVAAAVRGGARVHVGCQVGADAQVIAAAPASSLVVFAVADKFNLPAHVQQARRAGAQVVPQAGGTRAPVPARFLLRSVAAFQSCGAAVFFEPGAGSLAVAREAVRAGLPVYVFADQEPAGIPEQVGAWHPGECLGFPCFEWQALQIALF